MVLSENQPPAAGYGWSIVDVCRLHEVNDTVSIEAGDGNRVQFTAETDGAYTPSVGDFSRLSKAGNGTFTWTQADMFIRVFDANGRQTSVSDPIGNTTTMTYDANGELLTVTDPVGKVTTFTYNDSSRFTSIADPFGRKTTFETDAHGDLTKITNPDGTARTFTYDAQHRMTQQTDAAGNQTQYTYNASNQITRVDRADGSNTLYNTETAQNLINNLPSGSATESNPLSLADRTAPSYTDGAGNTYTFATNPFGTRTSITDPMGRTTVMNRNGDDQVISLVTPSGNTVSYEYDDRGNMTRIEAEKTVTFTYHTSLNLPVTIEDDTFGTWQFSYDDTGNLTQAVWPSGTTYTYTYSPSGQRASETVGGQTTEFTYNADGNLASVTDPAGGVTAFTYDTYGNVAGVTDADGRTSAAVYNTMNLLTRMTNGAGETAEFAYAPARGSDDLQSVGPIAVVTRITDGRGNATSFSYDSMYRLTGVTDALGNASSIVWDGAGRTISYTAPTGAKVALTYNAAGQLTRKAVAGGQTYDYSYNGASGLLTSAASTVHRIDVSYDVFDRPNKVTSTFLPSNFQASVLYSHPDTSGYENVQLEASGNTLDFGVTFDSTYGELPSMLYGDYTSGIWLYPRHDGAGRRTGWETQGFDLQGEFTYDAADRLSGKRYYDSTGTIFQAGWKYSPAGRMTEATDLDGTHQFTYDDAGRLVKATHPTPDNPTENYSYDQAGNRRVVGQESSFEYDAANRLLADPLYTCEYDASGNLVKKTNKTTSAVTQYTYDAEDKLTSASLPNGETAAFAYDPFGRRIEMRVGTKIVHYVFDGDEEFAEFDENNQLVRSYFNGQALDMPEGMIDGDFAWPVEHFYYTDPLGTILAVGDDWGKIAATYRYQAYGQPVAAPGALGNPRLFTARNYDAETGLYYMRHRFYDPAAGRFLQRDPVAVLAALAPYAYADNDPVNTRDPLGLQPPGPGWWTSWNPNTFSSPWSYTARSIATSGEIGGLRATSDAASALRGVVYRSGGRWLFGNSASGVIGGAAASGQAGFASVGLLSRLNAVATAGYVGYKTGQYLDRTFCLSDRISSSMMQTYGPIRSKTLLNALDWLGIY